MTSPHREHMSVAVVGYGSIGRRHCDNLARLGVGRRVAIRRPSASNPAFVAPDGVLVLHSIEDSIANGIDLAMICNPTSLHMAAARQYLAAGVAVLVEKPLAADLLEAERFTAEAEASSVPTGMAYCLRYHPAYVVAREHLRQGTLGRIRQARAWFESYLPDWHPWEDFRQSYAARSDLGGGVLPTLDHEIDFMLWCLGPPRGSTGIISRSGLLDADIDDTARLSFAYDGHTAELTLSIGNRRRRRGFEFVGDKASLLFSFEGQHLRWIDHERQTETTLWRKPDYDVNQMYLALLDDTLKALADGAPFPVPIGSGLEALRLAR